MVGAVLTDSRSRPVLRGPSNPMSSATATMAADTTANIVTGPNAASTGSRMNGSNAFERRESA
jgi:hypothetical protein